MRNESVFEENYKGYDIKIYQDDCQDSPGDWGDESIFLVGFHRNFWVTGPNDMKQETAQEIYRQLAGEGDPENQVTAADYIRDYYIFGLEAYIHSGVRLAFRDCGEFPDRGWDVSNVGFVFIKKEIVKDKESASKSAAGLIESWNDYLSGNVYGYQITKPKTCEHCGHTEDVFIDCCYGFYGDYEAGALVEARFHVDGIKKERAVKA
jgi:hypothetical protein